MTEEAEFKASSSTRRFEVSRVDILNTARMWCSRR